MVVSAETKAIRRAFVPFEEGTPLKCQADPGEQIIIAPIGDFDTAVFAATGIIPPQPRAAVLDASGKVESVIAADPRLDAIPGKRLVNVKPEIVIGDVLDEDGNVVHVEPVKEQPLVEK